MTQSPKPKPQQGTCGDRQHLGPKVGRFTSEVVPVSCKISPPFTTGISIDGFCLKIALNALVNHLFPYSHGHVDPYPNVAVRMFLSFPEGLVVGTSSSFALRGTDPLAYIYLRRQQKMST